MKTSSKKWGLQAAVKTFSAGINLFHLPAQIFFNETATPSNERFPRLIAESTGMRPMAVNLLHCCHRKVIHFL